MKVMEGDAGDLADEIGAFFNPLYQTRRSSFNPLYEPSTDMVQIV